MVLVGLYIAIGSGVPAVRAYFEMTDLEFFNAWPLKMLMGLLIVNLTVVTWTRIPFTAPRYGVWTIHAGIIILILGLASYYSMKVEGTTLIPVHETVDHFYDSTERMLYVRLDGASATAHRLPSLPRFRAYSPELGNTAKLKGEDLHNIVPYIQTRDDAGILRSKPLAQAIGLSELSLDVAGYWPYANIVDDYVEGEGDLTGVKVTLTSPHEEMQGMGRGSQWLVGTEDNARSTMMGPAEVEHIPLASQEEIDAVIKGAKELHRLEIKVGDFQQTLLVEPGKTYALGSSGYSITIEDFNPAFPMFGTNEIAKVLTIHVKTPAQEFRRQLLAGKKDKQTDFKLGVEGAGPFGKRQKELLDKSLDIAYEFHDPFNVLPSEGAEKDILFTIAGEKSITLLSTSFSREARTQRLESGTGQIALDIGGGRSFNLAVERKEKLRHDQRVVVVPVKQRTRRGGETGAYQVLLVRVKAGDWQQTIPVPYLEYANDGVPWSGGKLKLPNNRELQLQLGNTSLELPARITLDKFELVHYPGGNERSTLQRDFRSTLTIQDPSSGRVTHGAAYMNHPVYFDKNDWLFYQASWDMDGQKYTVLGVGNRPGMWTMTLGCIMVFVGLMYAFYVKPILVMRNKKAALEKFGANKKTKKREELVGVKS